MVSELSLPAPELSTLVKEVPIGATAVLNCNSNDDRHNFLFWQLGQNKVIGPGNDFDQSKYKYEVLSGKLFIKKVTSEETGYYRCISKSISSGNLNIGAVEMVVKNHLSPAPEPDSSDLETVKIVFIVISLVVLIICAVLFYRLRKNDKIPPSSRLVMIDDDDEDGSGDEIYNRTTTVINDSVPGPSKRPTEHITGIDNRGLDEDFNAAFEQISIKAANRDLV